MIGVPSGTAEWVKARIGIVTASRLGDVMAKRKDKQEAAPRRNYMRELVAERMTGFAIDHYVSPAMQWGLDYENEGKEYYEALSGNLIEPAGFILHRSIADFGATPDGFLSPDGVFEMKAPTTSTHLDWIIDGKVPPEYKPQMLGEMMCTGRQWCDFSSYDPRMPENKRLFVRRYEPTAAEFAEIEDAVRAFLLDLDRLWEAVHS